MAAAPALHRRIQQYEWADATGGGGVSSQRGGSTPGSGSRRPGSARAQPVLAATLAPSTVTDATLVCSERTALLIGGYDIAAHHPCRQVFAWDLVSRQWSRLPADIPQGVTRAAAVSVEDHFLLFGGFDGTRYSDTLWLLARPKPDTPASPPTGAGRRSVKERPTTAGGGGGGFDAAGGAGRDYVAWERLPPQGTQVMRPGPAPCGRCGHALVLGTAPSPVGGGASSCGTDHGSHNAETAAAAAERGSTAVATAAATSPPLMEPVVYLFGGFDGQRRHNDVWRLWVRPTLVMREAVWERVQPSVGIPPAPRDDAAVAFDQSEEIGEGRLFVFGGFTSSFTNDIHVLKLKKGECEWRSVTCGGSAPQPRHRAVAAIADGSLVVCGGEGDGQRCFAQLLQFSLQDHRWRVVLLDHGTEYLAGRFGAVSCCGDRQRRLLLFGGNGDGAHGACDHLTSMVEVELKATEEVPRKK